MGKITSILIIIIAAIAVVTEVVNVYISNTTALDSILATKLEAQATALDARNMELRDSILSYTAYRSIASRAATLGYVTSRDIVSVYDPVKVAIGR